MNSDSDQLATPPEGELLLYFTSDLDRPLQVRLQGETVWLSQRQMAELYGVRVATINEHVSNIIKESELKAGATIRKYLIVQIEGQREVRRTIDHYNLDMILAVGFRVRSVQGTKFRQWATERISEYLIKGFTMDDERLKGNAGVTDHFDELLERIRDIRASEARVYLMLRNIFALAADYYEGEQQTQLFFATMQNKMHYAATGLTAAEIVKQRADAAEPNMGLTSWKGSQVLKSDVGIAKNYLSEIEIDTLNRITVMFLDQAEFRAQRRQNIYMADWEGYLDKFLDDVELPILTQAGSISRIQAIEFAATEYEEFSKKRRLQIESKTEHQYIDDLKQSIETLKSQRKAPKPE